MSFIAEIPGSAFATVRQRVARHLLDLASAHSGVECSRSRSANRSWLTQWAALERSWFVFSESSGQEGYVDTGHDGIGLLDPRSSPLRHIPAQVEPRFRSDETQVADKRWWVRDSPCMSSIVEPASIPSASIDALDASQWSGLSPGRPSYEDHRRVWNGSIDRNPALIVRCSEVADVSSAVLFAQEHGLLTAVRGGGHSFPGHSTCDGGIVIDLRPMNGIRVDPDARTARVEAGVLLGELDLETQRFGLAVPAGVVSHTGIAGLTLGGGTGWQQRKHGLSIDNLLSVDLVTADGDQVTASQDENADLFWGVRGGGGNFGIVTSFEFRMRPIGPQVMSGPVFWSMEDTACVLRFYRDWIAGLPGRTDDDRLPAEAP